MLIYDMKGTYLVPLSDDLSYLIYKYMLVISNNVPQISIEFNWMSCILFYFIDFKVKYINWIEVIPNNWIEMRQCELCTALIWINFYCLAVSFSDVYE